MKTLLILAIFALTAAITACTDVRSTVAPSFENEPVAQINEEHLFTSCQAAVDNNATISYSLIISGNESTLIRTYKHSFDRGADVACTAVKENAANNEKINCTENAVETITEYENLTVEDYNALIEAECQANK